MFHSVLCIVKANYQHAITAVGNTSTEVEVETFLQAVVLAFGECGAALGIDISLGVDVEINLDSLVA